MDKNYNVTTLQEGLAQPFLLILAQLKPYLLKQYLRTQEKLKELEIMQQNSSYTCIS